MLKQIKALAKITIINKREKMSFDAYLILNNTGEGRIDVLGAWNVHFFSLIFNPEFIYFYVPNESRLYYSRNMPEFFKKIIDVPLDSSILFDSLVSNLPESLSESSGTILKDGKYYHLSEYYADHGKELYAKIVIEDFPIVEELIWIAKEKHETCKVRYFDTIEQNGYILPKDVCFFWSKVNEWHIRFKSLKINPSISKEFFLPEAAWFEGEVVDLNSLNLQNGQIINDKNKCPR